MKTTTATAALADIVIAAENPRAKSVPVNIEGLAVLIAKYGLRRPLFVYEVDGNYHAFAGSRRYAALKMLQKQKLCPELLAAVPIVIHEGATSAEIRQLAIVDNDAEPMSKAEQVTAWSAMVKDGVALATIAENFNVSEHTVKQRIALANLQPAIFEAWATGKITIDVAQQYANAKPERQASVWKRLRGAAAQSWQHRDELRKGRLDPRDRIALYVGKKAYEAAGGKVDADLFTDRGDGPGDAYWDNPELAHQLATEKLKAECAELKKDGWKAVEEAEDDWYRTYEAADKEPKKADRGKYIFLVEITSKGAIAGQAVQKIKGAKPSKAAAAEPAKAEKTGPAPPMTNGAHEQITRAAAAIAWRAMSEQPDVAIIAFTAQLARERWGADDDGDRFDTTRIFSLTSPYEATGEVPALKTDNLAEAFEKDWRARFKGGFAKTAAEDSVAAMTTEVRTALLGYLLGSLVVMTERHAGGSNLLRRKRMAAIGQLAKIKPSAWFAPSAGLLKNFSRPELSKIAKELGVEEGRTKGATADAIAIAAADKGWVPPLMRDLLGAEAGKPVKPKPAKKAEKAGKRVHRAVAGKRKTKELEPVS